MAENQDSVNNLYTQAEETDIFMDWADHLAVENPKLAQLIIRNIVDAELSRDGQQGSDIVD